MLSGVIDPENLPERQYLGKYSFLERTYRNGISCEVFTSEYISICFFLKMNIFRVTSCPENVTDLYFPGNYPSHEKISRDRSLIIFDFACNPFNTVCLSLLEPEIIGMGKFPTPLSNAHLRSPSQGSINRAMTFGNESGLIA